MFPTRPHHREDLRFSLVNFVYLTESSEMLMSGWMQAIAP